MAAPRRSQALPILAPRGYARPAMTKSASFLPEQHTDKEWAVVYPHIVRMYVLERRKLRYVMTKMEEEFHFKAT
jgi:hypothetical protein